jgi:hypothetical protein
MNLFQIQIKGLAFFFNPTGENLSQILEVPLYYTGLTSTATVVFEDNQDTKQVFTLRRDYYIEIPISKFISFSSTHNI